MKTLGIIGANGMLGSDLVIYLSKYFLITLITKENYTKLRGKSFNVIINANGNSKRFWANKNPVEDFKLSTESVYNSLFDFGYENYVYISSSDVYEDHSNPSTTKETQSIISNNLSAYGLHKYLSELIVKRNVEKYLILRSSMILGKYLSKGPIFDILRGQSLFITKRSKLQMISTEVIAKIILNLLKRKMFGQTFNIGGRGTVDFKSIEKLVHRKIEFSKMAETQVYEMNVEKIAKIFSLKTSSQYLQEYTASLN